MKTRKIKTLLHESIENINDEALLLAVKEMLDRKYNPAKTPQLTTWQEKRIEESKEQIKAGKSFTSDQADNVVDKWLNE